MRVLAVLAALAFGAAGALGQTTPSGELTHPRAHPSSGTPHTAFAVTFTLRHDAGHRGVVQTTYRVRVGAPKGARRSCRPAAPRAVSSGGAGSRVRVALPAPSSGWCAGRYHATVWLLTGPYCPSGQRVCPKFASREQATGTVHFTVHAASR